jgi:hypothetical protein
MRVTGIGYALANLSQQRREVGFQMSVCQHTKQMGLSPGEEPGIAAFSGESCGPLEFGTGVVDPAFPFSKKPECDPSFCSCPDGRISFINRVGQLRRESQTTGVDQRVSQKTSSFGWCLTYAMCG